MSEGDPMSLLSMNTGSEPETCAVELVLPTCCLLTPAPISEEGFAEVISQVRAACCAARLNTHTHTHDFCFALLMYL